MNCKYVLLLDQDVMFMYQDVELVQILQLISEQKKVNVRELDVSQDISLIQKHLVVINVLLKAVLNVLELLEMMDKKPNGLVKHVVTINIFKQTQIKMVLNSKIVHSNVLNILSKETIILKKVKNQKDLMNVLHVLKLDHIS